MDFVKGASFREWCAWSIHPSNSLTSESVRSCNRDVFLDSSTWRRGRLLAGPADPLVGKAT